LAQPTPNLSTCDLLAFRRAPPSYPAELRVRPQPEILAELNFSRANWRHGPETNEDPPRRHPLSGGSTQPPVFVQRVARSLHTDQNGINYPQVSVPRKRGAFISAIRQQNSGRQLRWTRERLGRASSWSRCGAMPHGAVLLGSEKERADEPGVKTSCTSKAFDGWPVKKWGRCRWLADGQSCGPGRSRKGALIFLQTG